MGRDPVGFLQELRRCGDVVAFDLGPRRFHLVNPPELIRRVLVTDAHHFQRGEVFATARELLGDGLATADEPVHMRQRRVMQPAFHHARITAYTDLMRAEVAAFSVAPGVPVALDRELQRLTFTITARALFRTGPVDEVLRSLGPVLNGITLRAMIPFYSRLPGRKFTEALRRLTSAVDEVIASYRASGADHGDLLSMLVAVMGDDETRTQVMNVLMAGTETTATTLSWLFYELARHPAVRDGLGDPAYVDRVLHETLRLHTPIWLLTRRVCTPIQLGEMSLEPGAEVMVSLPTLHRDPALFPDPLRFDPDRWLTTSPAFIPFGAGRHKCIGDGFAWAAMTAAVTGLCSRWRFPLAPGHEVREVARAFLRPNALVVVPEPA